MCVSGVFSAINRLIAINRIENKSFCLHNICVCTVYIYIFCTYICIYIYIYIYIYISGGPLSALTCCVNARLLSAIKKISPLIYSQSWDGSWVYTTQAMMTFTLIF